VLESADRADSNSAVRKDVWVQVPPAVPDFEPAGIECLATPPDASACAILTDLDAAYVYLLGLYLGDGMLTRAPRNVWRLRISLDAKYPAILAEAKAAISEVGSRSAGSIAREGCFELYSNWKHWICLFPQHGAGRKHDRTIALATWQSGLTAKHPAAFLKGLSQRPDPLRWMSMRQPSEGTRLPTLLLLEPFR
jgi:hypothetical protein